LEFLAAVRRVLKPGGRFVVSTPNKDEFSNAGQWEFHEKEYTLAEFHAMLKEAGYNEISLLGQRLTERGRDRAEVREEMARIHHNPFLRFGRFLQRTLRGRKTELAILPERPEDFHFAPMNDHGTADGNFVLMGVAVR
jgi:SAM-dependent methyltransferase